MLLLKEVRSSYVFFFTEPHFLSFVAHRSFKILIFFSFKIINEQSVNINLLFVCMCPLDNAIKLNFDLPPKGACVPLVSVLTSFHCNLVPWLSIYQASIGLGFGTFAFAPGLQRREF